MKKENAAPAAGAQPELELKVRFLNINEGQNQELMERCRSLREYSEFVARIKLEKVDAGCSIANIPEGADIEVGDIVYYEPAQPAKAKK